MHIILPMLLLAAVVSATTDESEQTMIEIEGGQEVEAGQQVRVSKASPNLYRASPSYGGRSVNGAFLAQLAAEDQLDVINLGFKSALNVGTQQKYDGSVKTHFSANSISFKMGFTVSPMIHFYSETAWDTSYLVNPSMVVPIFVNANNTSRISLFQGFVLFGDLKKNPFYTYFGQARLPYAVNFSPTFATNLSTKLQGITQRALAIGHVYDKKDMSLNTEIFIFNGDTTPRSSPNSPTFGFNTSGKYPMTAVTSLEFKGGLLSNIADADGFQATNSSIASTEIGDDFDYGDYTFDPIDETATDILSQVTYFYSNFTGFATGFEFEKIQKRVPATALAIKINTIGKISISAAYSTALRAFSPLDLSYTSQGPFTKAPTDAEGARPSAWNAYISKKYLKDYTFYVGYEATAQALALNIPSKRLVLGASKNINPFVSVVIEARKDINYGTQTDARGSYNNLLVSSSTNDIVPGYYSQIPSAENGQLGQSSTAINMALRIQF